MANLGNASSSSYDHHGYPQELPPPYRAPLAPTVMGCNWGSNGAKGKAWKSLTHCQPDKPCRWKRNSWSTERCYPKMEDGSLEREPPSTVASI